MTDRPILFSSAMVQALLAGRKTQTRRVLNPQPQEDIGLWLAEHNLRFAAGDRLWVKHAYDFFTVYFKPVEFGDGKYAAGTDGHVYNMLEASPRQCKAQTNDKGYQRLTLRHQGKKLQVFEHTLIAEAFYGKAPPNFPECRHMDSEPSNNVPENLDWGTVSQNHTDMLATGKRIGEHRIGSSISLSQAREIREASGTHREIAERFGICRSSVSLIKGDRRWSGRKVSAPPRNTAPFQLWRSPIYMPRWASLVTLTVTDVRVQRLQEISKADAIAEGVVEDDGSEPDIFYLPGSHMLYGVNAPKGRLPINNHPDPRLVYRDLINNLHGGDLWSTNPWMVAVSFAVHKANIDNL